MTSPVDFVNLTNGIEAIPTLPPGWQVCRIRSTTIEKRDWVHLLGDLDHGLLFRLCRGVPCRVHDFGANRPTSKTVSVGVPLIRAVLSRTWLGVPCPDVLSEGAFAAVDRAETRQAQRAKEKLGYYARLAETDAVRLTGHSSATWRDGDWEYYLRVLAGCA